MLDIELHSFLPATFKKKVVLLSKNSNLVSISSIAAKEEVKLSGLLAFKVLRKPSLKANFSNN